MIKVSNVVCFLLAGTDIILTARPALDCAFITSIFAAVALMGRQRWPHLTFAAALPGVAFGYAELAALIALYSLAVVERRRWVYGCAGMAAASCLLCGGLELSRTSFPDLVHTTGWALLSATASLGLGVLVRTRRELADLATRRERERTRHAQQIRAAEQARLAREMHDIVSHHVSLIALMAGALRNKAPDTATAATADTLRQLAVRTLDELRHLLGVLRQSPSDPQAPAGTSDLRQLLAHHPHATLHIDGLDGIDVPEPVQQAVYRTVQEALTNIGKYAPGALTTVHLAVTGDYLTLKVTNRTVALVTPAPDLPSGHHGLSGLRERAQLLGGDFHAHRLPEGGFQVQLTVPLHIPACAASELSPHYLSPRSAG